MFGWRKRIGYIGPTVMEVVPYEFYRFAPGRRRPRRRHLQHRRLEQGSLRPGARAGHDGRGVSRLARRRFHPARRRTARGRARQGIRRDHRQGHRGRRQGACLDRRARRHGCAAAIDARRVVDRLALSRAAQHRDGRLPRRSSGSRSSAPKGMDVPFKSLQSRDARRDQGVCHRRARSRRAVRRALSALPAMAGRAGRRCARAGDATSRRSPIRMRASSSHSRRSASRTGSTATAGCWRRWRR